MLELNRERLTGSRNFYLPIMAMIRKLQEPDAVAYFWGLMTAGGVLGLVLLKIMDSRKVLIIFTVLALVCLTAALFGSAKISLIAFPAVGFFASVMYPIIFSLALNSVNEHHGSFSGILMYRNYWRCHCSP